MVELRTRAIEANDEHAIGCLVGLVILLARVSQILGYGGEACEEARIKAQFAKEFERSEKELDRLAKVAAKSLPTWWKEVAMEAVGRL